MKDGATRDKEDIKKTTLTSRRDGVSYYCPVLLLLHFIDHRNYQLPFHVRDNSQ